MNNYSTSLDLMEHAIINLRNITGTSSIIQIIENIIQSIIRSKINVAVALGLNNPEIDDYENGLNLIDQFLQTVNI